MRNKSVLESYSTYNIVESEKERVLKTLKAREAAKPKPKKATLPKQISPKVRFIPKKSASPKPKSVKANNNQVCDDSKTRRSTRKTTIMGKDGKPRRGKLIDLETKNCMFPFKNMVSQGKGKSRKAVMETECVEDKFGAYCATERNPDCTPKKVAYCK